MARFESVSTEAVPEPTTMFLFGLGAAGLAARKRFGRRREGSVTAS